MLQMRVLFYDEVFKKFYNSFDLAQVEEFRVGDFIENSLAAGTLHRKLVMRALHATSDLTLDLRGFVCEKEKEHVEGDRRTRGTVSTTCYVSITQEERKFLEVHIMRNTKWWTNWRTVRLGKLHAVQVMETAKSGTILCFTYGGETPENEAWHGIENLLGDVEQYLFEDSKDDF